MIVRANNKREVRCLMYSMIILSEEDKRILLSVAYKLGLMKPRGLIINLSFWAVKKFRDNNIDLFLKKIQERSPDTITQWFEDMYNHVFFGKDTIDLDSVGGWCQYEIDMFLASTTHVTNFTYYLNLCLSNMSADDITDAEKENENED